MVVTPTQVRDVLDRGRFHPEFQPLYSLHTGTIIGVEALTRFTGSAHGPGPWFAAARTAGLAVELELATAKRALEAGADVPEHVRVWVNLSPHALIDPRAWELFATHPVAALGIELTEQGPPTEWAALRDRCQRLQRAGVRIAVDDVGGSWASARTLGRVRPDDVKIDLAVTHDLESSWRRLQARRIVAAARRRGATVVAEGVETPAQLAHWTRLGADAAQGFLLAPPARLEEALTAAPIVGLAQRTVSAAQATAPPAKAV